MRLLNSGVGLLADAIRTTTTSAMLPATLPTRHPLIPNNGLQIGPVREINLIKVVIDVKAK